MASGAKLNYKLETGIEGLQIWTPDVTFNARYNIVALQEGLSGLKAIDVMFKPDGDQLYITGTNDRVIYHTVDPESVKRKHTQLLRSTDPIYSCLQLDQPVEKPKLYEEAHVRELHLGMGRACLLLASLTEDRNVFKSSAQDLIKIFSLVSHPIHSLSDIETTPLRKQGLLYTFLQAARTHKQILKTEADKIVDAIDSAVLPLEDGKTWKASRGEGYANRIGYEYGSVATSKKPPKQKKKKTPDNTDFKLFIAEENEADKGPTNAQIFIGALKIDRKLRTLSQTLSFLHDAYCQEETAIFKEYNNKARIDMVRKGIKGYLETMSKTEHDIPGQLLSYLNERGSNRGLTRIIVAGNVIAAKVNEKSGSNSPVRELPGFGEDALIDSFKVIRYACRNPGIGRRETDNARKFGDIVEKFITATAPSKSYQDVS